MSIVVVTAIPYAAARDVEVWNTTTSPTQPIISSQFTSGTYTCPMWRSEVCRIARRGR